MRSHFTILMLALVTSPATGANQRPVRVTGNQLLAELRGGPNARHDFDKPYAQGYMAGVADVNLGTRWCAPADLSVAQLDDQVLDTLATHAVGSMTGAAATVLAEQFHSSFPLKGAACAAKPRLTGDQFVSWLLGDVLERERYVAGYAGGVVDATEGVDWCAPARIKPHELEERGWANLVDRPRGSMPENAAVLLRQQFISKYPGTQR
jgi:Rap1a immunity proteins